MEVGGFRPIPTGRGGETLTAFSTESNRTPTDSGLVGFGQILTEAIRVYFWLAKRERDEEREGGGRFEKGREG